MSTDGPRYPQYPGQVPDRVEPLPPMPPAPAGVDPSAPELAGWWIRVGAAVVDGLILLAVVVVPLVAGLVVLFADATVDEAAETVTGLDPLGFVVLGLAGVLYVGFDVWNRGLRTGYRGQSLGKQALGLHVVGRHTGATVGAADGFFRWLVALLLQWTCLGQLLDLLWPLWDGSKQTIHDKAIGTLVVRR